MKNKIFLTAFFLLFIIFVNGQINVVESNLYGKYQITANAKGSLSSTYTITLNKPANATTVYKAYVYKVYRPNYLDPSLVHNGNLTIDGSSYVLTNSTSSAAPSGTSVSNPNMTYYKEVSDNTSFITKLNQATAGTNINTDIVEPDTSAVEGIGIIVIWNTPTSKPGTFFVMIGSELITTTGLSKAIDVLPLDVSKPDLEPVLGIGISFSTGVSGQTSVLKVNGNTITSNAGGYDDGVNTGGGLITLGGYGDDANSNDADELYNIKSQLTNGVSNLAFTFQDVNTINDDFVNVIYFAGSGLTPPICNFAPTLSASTAGNTCPANTVNLNNLLIDTIPNGAEVRWFTNNTHTGAAYATPTAATAGTYYAYYYDSTNNCYSPASSAVTVTITPCCAAGNTAPNIN